MHESWLTNMDHQTAVIVPTRSLVNILQEDIAKGFLRSNTRVWETPNILTWQDYIQLLWQSNRQLLSQSANAHTLISAQQGLMLWTQVIEESRQGERDLTLLNVQQTARAAQRSWRLLHDWQIPIASIADDHVADALQFCEWAVRYQAKLAKRGIIDDQLLLIHLLNNSLVQPYRKLIWYAYDLVTNVQRSINLKATSDGVRIEHRQPASDEHPDREHLCYADSDEEISVALRRARAIIEAQPEFTINIVVPDLQNRQAQVRELARDVFYPGITPLQLQQQNLVYRFSLGFPLNRWPAIETALVIVKLLKGRISVNELSFLFRNQFLRSCRKWRAETRDFERWLQRHRIRMIGIAALPGLYQQSLVDARPARHNQQQDELGQFLAGLVAELQKLQGELGTQKQTSGYRALPCSRWIEVISAWLEFWGWSTALAQDKLNSVQFQLQERWQSLLTEFGALQIVQRQAGLSRACEILQQMARDTVFLPKAATSPILISGVFEAIGRPVDLCILTGMDDRYPGVLANDPFIANSLRAVVEYPNATSRAYFEQSQKVIESLLAGADRVVISYAKQDPEEENIERGLSALFRHIGFIHNTALPPAMEPVAVPMERYTDISGPAWREPKAARGGSFIFENQSNCAFKAFATHQLGCVRDEQPEFGLDVRDRGVVVHRLLDTAWAELQSQQRLLNLLAQGQLSALVESLVNQVLEDPTLKLLTDKRALLQLEKPRLVSLLNEWLLIEAARPVDYSVTEREVLRHAEFAGIGFDYRIDRLDKLEDGRTVVIDYKTGVAVKSDWQGARMRRPQLPLYVVALEQAEQAAIAGVAYARVKQYECKYEELAEAGIFRAVSKVNLTLEEKWQESHAAWAAKLEQLGKAFLAGNAEVNPIDESTCSYCELHSFCRVSQLRAESNARPNGSAR